MAATANSSTSRPSSQGSTATGPMPVLWPDHARAQLGEQRYADALADPRDVDLLTWNVFQSLETHHDQDWLAYRLQQLGGTDVTAPVRMQLWTGRDTDPELRPSRGYVKAAAERATAAGASEEVLAAIRQPIEVAVRIESPQVLCLVETMMDTLERGTDGRDRLLELIDAGLDQARRLSKTLAVAVVYLGGSTAATQVSARLHELRRTLPQELPHQAGASQVVLREVSWQQLLRVWESELGHLDIPGSPRALLDHVKATGLY